MSPAKAAHFRSFYAMRFFIYPTFSGLAWECTISGTELHPLLDTENHRAYYLAYCHCFCMDTYRVRYDMHGRYFWRKVSSAAAAGA